MLGLTKRVALIVLSVWLIATGLFAVADIGFASAGLILNLLAIVAGVLILLQAEKWSAQIGMTLLGIWLAATGLMPLIAINIQAIGLVLNLLAIAAGVLILVER